YLNDYPNQKETAHVRELMGLVVARLVKHELYVARFYLGRDNYDAAVARIQYALRNYSPGGSGAQVGISADANLRAEALLLLGETYLKMRKWGDARKAFETIVAAYAETPLVVQARNYLQHLHEMGA